MNVSSLHPNRTGSTAAAPAAPQAARWLALGAIIGPILFTLAWIILGVLQPATQTDYGVMGGISGAISNPISGLGIGPNALLFNVVGFVLSGLMTFVGVVAVFQTTQASGRAAQRAVCAVLLALSPLGMALAGIFTLKSSVMLHSVAALVGFLAAIVGFVAAGFYFRETPRWRRFGNGLLVAAPLSLALMVAYFLSFNIATVAAGNGVAGLTERIFILEVHAWYVALGWSAWRRA
jgi:hypothetical protein